MRSFVLLFIMCVCQSRTVTGSCSNVHSTCGNCSIDSNCLWCLDPPGCIHKSKECKSSYKLENSILKSSHKESNTQKQRHIYPESVFLQLVPGVEQEVAFEVTQINEYPVDLYFLMDLSWSMSGARDNIAIQGENIVREITKLTKNLRIGFGSFIEKNVAPFTSDISKFNCPGNPNNCSPPYSFHHQMPMQKLSPDTFRKKIMSASLGGNVEEPEASFDGLVQTMTCHHEIGWRNNSRKIILLTTDGDFHFALDGKLLGLLQPNDGNCHLDSNGYFTQEKNMDYPSVSQIDAIASTGSYTLIFAVASQYHDIYKVLSKQISGSSVASLEKDAMNIVEIIRDIYEKITSTVSVSLKKEMSKDKSYTVKIYANCAGDFKLGSDCQSVEVGTPVQFKALVKVNDCFEGRKTFHLKVVGIPEHLSVELESKCNCDCENSGAGPSKLCKFNGVFQCGVCYCQQGFMGEHCDCENEFTLEEQNEACMSLGESEGANVTCSNRGKCICGECKCSEPFYGSHCQCDNSSCPLSTDGEICSNNGKCVCNECKCDSKWEGINCGCSKDKSRCKSPFNGLECSGNGLCKCNSKCICKEDFSGKFCQILPTTSDSCSLLRDCMEKRLFGEEFNNKQTEKECSIFEIIYVSSNVLKSSNQGDLCVFTREKDGCTYEFESRLTSENRLMVYAIDDEDLRCSYYGVNYLTISLITVGITVFLGLLGIIGYKVYLAYLDKREYERFLILKENQKFALNQNALYKNPVSKYKNPIFRPSRSSER